MAYTWDQIGNLGLTAAQKTKLAEAEAIGRALKGGTAPDTSAVTAEQAKKVINFYRDLEERPRFAVEGAKYIISKLRHDAAQSADASVPEGSL
jgi:hypothetical protein